jgi:hypothetical protein
MDLLELLKDLVDLADRAPQDLLFSDATAPLALSITDCLGGVFE